MILSEEEQVVFELAYSLGMPVYKMMEEMPHDEFMAWISYFESRPIGWRDDLRAAYLMNAFGDKRPPAKIFPSIAAVMAGAKPADPISSLKTSFLFNQMLTAVNGDKLDFLKD